MKATDKQKRAAEETALRAHLFFDELPNYDKTLLKMYDGKYPKDVCALDAFEYADADDVAEAIECMYSSIIEVVETE